ncbi:hypothetical protein PGIGA_G00254130, partial [Pangasianodon gigas]|nr:hypothetical protein [Pangasianodon gigas]
RVTTQFSRKFFTFLPAAALPYTFLWVWLWNLSTVLLPEAVFYLSSPFSLSLLPSLTLLLRILHFPAESAEWNCRDYRLEVMVVCAGHTLDGPP